MMLKLIDRIITEIKDKNILDEIRYIVLSSETLKELQIEFDYEFAVEYEELGRKPSRADLEQFFGKKILIDETITAGKKYNLLTKS